jgi:hypothetical protein
MKKNFNKKGAVELSIGTIVIIVLAMSMMILGIVLVKNIFNAGIDIVDMTDAQLKNQVSQLFGEDKRLVMYPDSREVKLKLNEQGGFGFGIKNLLTGTASQDAKFSYEVVVSDEDITKKCGVSEQEIERWIETGRTESNILIPPGEVSVGKVIINIPEGSTPCTFRLRVNIKQNNANYATDIMDVIVRP